MPRYYFDIETDGFLENVTVITSLVLKDMDTGEVTSCADRPGYMPIGSGLRMLRHASEICGHNIIRYDIPVIQKLYPDWQTEAKITDTLVMVNLFYPTIRDTDFGIRKRQMERGREPTLPGKLIGRQSLEAWGYRMGAMKGDYSDVVKGYSKQFQEEGSLRNIPEDYHVLVDEDAKGKQYLNPWKAWCQPLQDYCEQDVEVTSQLYEMIASKRDINGEWAQALDIEQRFTKVLHLQEIHGFRFDEQKASVLERELREKKAVLEAGLFDLFEPWWVGTKVFTPGKPLKKFVEHPEGGITRTDKKETGETYSHTQKNGKVVQRKVKVEVERVGYYEYTDPDAPFMRAELRVFNPASRQQIEDRLRKLYGWQPTEFTPTGLAEINDEVLNDLPYPPAKRLAEYFMYDKRLGMLADGKKSWYKYLKNGRIHGRVNPLGAITGRCTHSNPNIAQVPSIENAKGVVPYGAECRDLFCADEGHDLVGCDASGLELRCLAHFMNDGGRYARAVLEGDKSKGTDIHTMNQKAAGLPSRSNAKTFI